MSGTVITFYSYKGGVGRSFTLANTAVLLARWGYRVLAVDWDLEAPGLHLYFRPHLSEMPPGSVVDLAYDFIQKIEHPASYAPGCRRSTGRLCTRTGSPTSSKNAVPSGSPGTTSC